MPLRLLFLLSACSGKGDDSAPAPDSDADTDADSDTDTDADTDTDTDTESVTLRLEPCESAPGTASRCASYEVRCGGAEPAVVDVLAYEPTKGIERTGVVLMMSGGAGTGWYNFTRRDALTAQGYTLLERRWQADGGWFEGGTEGPSQVSCRGAALIRFLAEHEAKGTTFCASGNSGGSAELTYALTWHGAGTVLDFALPTSGPFHRLDHACQGETDKAWVAECEALVASECPTCAADQCQLGTGVRSIIDLSYGPSPRCTAPGKGDLDVLEAGSPILGADAATLGGVPTAFLIGTLDDAAYMPLVAALHRDLDALGADVRVDYVDDAIHEMDDTKPGADAIEAALLARCVPRD